MSRKIILVTGTTKDNNGRASFSVSPAYAQAIFAAGGIPVGAISNRLADEYAQMADGLIITGGESVHPRYYGETFRSLAHDNYQEEKRLQAGCNVPRDEYEMALFHAFEKLGKPIMGICRGHQLVNAAMGGKNALDFYQDHKAEHGMGISHMINIEPGTALYELYGEKMLVNSFHRDCAVAPGPDAKVVARSEDGIIEAVQHNTLPIFSFQFHPERMRGENPQPLEGPNTDKLFKYFVDIC